MAINSLRDVSIPINDNSTHTKILPILLVEDYEAIILIATTIFQYLGYAYEVVNNGQEAVDIFNPGKYSLILMDMQMPFLNGYEATDLIRKCEAANASEAITIIGMTANSLRGDREKCLQAGMDDYLGKPFTFLQLEAILGKYLKVAEARAM